MKCEACLEMITDLARGQLVDSRERHDTIEHISSCPSCALTLEQERALQAALRTVRDQDLLIQSSPRIAANLQSAFRARTINAESLAPKRVRLGVASLAAAATLTLAFAGVAYWLQSKTTNESVPQHTHGAIVVPHREVTPAATGNSVSIPRTLRKDRVKAKNRVASSFGVATVTHELGEFRPVRAGSELSTEFMPLRETRGLPPSESGQVIRIEMPRSALAYFGLPMAFEQPGQKVKADVLVADDGLARAIRFVR